MSFRRSEQMTQLEKRFIGRRVRMEPKFLYKYFDEAINETNANHPAVILEDERKTSAISFSDLRSASNRLARVLIDILAVQPSNFRVSSPVIAIRLRPSCEAITCMLAIWKTGCGYMPIHFRANSPHVDKVLTDVKPLLLVVDHLSNDDSNVGNLSVVELPRLLKEAETVGDDPLPEKCTMADRDSRIALLLHSMTLLRDTKGTKLYHSSLQQSLEWQWHERPYAPEERFFVAFHSCFHINNFFEIWSPLLRGRSVVLMSNETREDTAKLARLMVKYDVSRFYGSPKKIADLLDFASELDEGGAQLLEKLSKDGEAFGKNSEILLREAMGGVPEVGGASKQAKFLKGLPRTIDEKESVADVISDKKEAKKSPTLDGIRVWLSTSEELTKRVALKFFEHFRDDGRHTLVNLFGCCETSGAFCSFTLKSREQVQKLAAIPLGDQICPNTRVYLLDKANEVVGLGESGEICVSGVLLAKGYANSREPWNRTFVENPHHFEPIHWALFKTGNHGRVVDGALHLVPHKSKLFHVGREQSVNLPALNLHIRAFPYVESAAVVAHEGELLAFIKLHRKFSGKEKREIEADLLQQLPQCALPKIVLVFTMPMEFDANKEREKIALKKLLADYSEKVKRSRGTEVNVSYDYAGVDATKRTLVTKIFAIIARNIGSNLRGVVSLGRSFFDLGGSAKNVLKCVHDLCAENFDVSIEEFVRAKDLHEVVQRISDNYVAHNSFRKFDMRLTVDASWRTLALLQADADECIEFVAEYCCTRIDLMNFHPRMTKDKLVKFLTKNWYYFVNNRYSFKVLQGVGNSLIGVSLNIDHDDRLFIDTEGVEEMVCIFEYLEFVAEDFELSLYRNKKILSPHVSATLFSLSLVDEIRLHQFMEGKLIEIMDSSEFDMIYSLCTNPLVSQLRRFIFGYRTPIEYPVHRYSDKNGERPFEGVDADIKTAIQFLCNVRRRNQYSGESFAP